MPSESWLIRYNHELNVLCLNYHMRYTESRWPGDIWSHTQLVCKIRCPRGSPPVVPSTRSSSPCPRPCRPCSLYRGWPLIVTNSTGFRAPSYQNERVMLALRVLTHPFRPLLGVDSSFRRTDDRAGYDISTTLSSPSSAGFGARSGHSQGSFRPSCDEVVPSRRGCSLRQPTLSQHRV